MSWKLNFINFKDTLKLTKILDMEKPIALQISWTNIDRYKIIFRKIKSATISRGDSAFSYGKQIIEEIHISSMGSNIESICFLNVEMVERFAYFMY